MSHPLFEPGKAISVRAYLSGQRFDLKTFDKSQIIATAPLTVRAGTQGYATLFRFGTIVFFNTTEKEEHTFLDKWDDFLTAPFDKLEEEFSQLMSTDQTNVSTGLVSIENCQIEHLQTVATVLSKSVYLAYYEEQITRIFNMIEPMALDMKKSGKAGYKTKKLLSHIGEVLLIEGRMVGRVEIEDKPDLIWERPDLDQLYIQMSNEYELKDRMASLRQKLNLIHVTADTLLSFQQNRSTHHVEWYIVILILVEIFMSLGEKYLGF